MGHARNGGPFRSSCSFLTRTIRLGYEGKDGALVKARDAGERYLRQSLLPEWSRDATFAIIFWIGNRPSTAAARYGTRRTNMMNRREAFPNWQSDVRNLFRSISAARASILLPRAGRTPAHGPAESSGCCGQSLQYSTMSLAAPLAPTESWPTALGARGRPTTDDPFDLRRARDGRGGRRHRRRGSSSRAPGTIWPTRGRCAACWRRLLAAGNWGPIARTTSCGSTSVVRTIPLRQGPGCLFHLRRRAPPARTCCGWPSCPSGSWPTAARCNGRPCCPKTALRSSRLPMETRSSPFATTASPTCCRRGRSQQVAEDTQLTYSGPWLVEPCAEASGGNLHVASAAGAETSFAFEGNQCGCSPRRTAGRQSRRLTSTGSSSFAASTAGALKRAISKYCTTRTADPEQAHAARRSAGREEPPWPKDAAVRRRGAVVGGPR